MTCVRPSQARRVDEPPRHWDQTLTQTRPCLIQTRAGRWLTFVLNTVFMHVCKVSKSVDARGGAPPARLREFQLNFNACFARFRKASTRAEARLHRASVSFNAILMHVLGGFKAHGGDGDSGLYNTKKGSRCLVRPLAELLRGCGCPRILV